MKIRPEIERKVQETLDSLDGIQRAEPQPYFYTRLMGRLQRNERSIWEHVGAFIARPVVAMASLGLILILNVFLLTRTDATTTTSNIVSSNEPVATDEYILASSSSFDYENIDQ